MATCAATGEIFETTESTGGRTAETFATMPATSVTTALKCARTYEMVTTARRELNGATYDMISATYTPIAATFVTTAAISGTIAVTFVTTAEDNCQ